MTTSFCLERLTPTKRDSIAGHTLHLTRIHTVTDPRGNLKIITLRVKRESTTSLHYLLTGLDKLSVFTSDVFLS